METRVTRRIGEGGASRTSHFTAPTLEAALEAALAELREAGGDWVGWRVDAWRSKRGKRAQLELTFLRREEVARLKAERGAGRE